MRIPLEDGKHTYGRMLEANPWVAYHDFRTSDENPDLLTVVKSPVLFVLAGGGARALSNGEWTKVGEVSLGQIYTPIPPQFMQNIGNLKELDILEFDGSKRSATFEECEGLEAVATWQAEHVEERLNAHYAGRESWVVKDLALKKP
jgi:hypothetical protein